MRRILAVRQDNNGDVTLQGPAVRALAQGGEVILVCGPSGEGAGRLLPEVAEVHVVRADWIEGSPQPVNADAVARDVVLYASLGVDEAFVFTSFHQSPLPTALLLKLAGIPAVAAVGVDYPGSLLDTRARVDDDMHEVERALALVATRGYTLPAGDDGGLRYVTLGPRLGSLPARYVALQPGATVPSRAWAVSRMRSLAARLRAAAYDVVILGSQSEVALGKEVAGDSGALNLCGETTYAEFASVVRDAEALVVGNSSGIHVASAVGTPVVTVFAPTILPLRFAPWRVPHVMLGDHAIACAGCRAKTCPFEGQPCTGTVRVEDVMNALCDLGVTANGGRTDMMGVSA